MALGRGSISGVTEGSESRGTRERSGYTAKTPYKYGSQEGRRSAGIRSAERSGRIGNGVSEQSAISRNFANKGDDLSDALRGAIEGNGRRGDGTFLGIDWAAAVGAAGFFTAHWYDGPHPLGAID